MFRYAIAVALSTVVFGGTWSARAADYATPAPVQSSSHCPWSGASTILSLTNEAAIEEAVHLRFNESVAVSESPQWIYNRAPVFTWATEAKVACGKAIGYMTEGRLQHMKLHRAFVHEDYTRKCDCFYQIMKSHMAGR